MDWWQEDPRYGAKGWTLIWPSDGGRPYFVKVSPRKPRAKPRALRFGELKVGDVLIHRGKIVSERYVPPAEGFTPANENRRTEVEHYAGFYVVEHRWFDPCAGHDDRWAGEMAGVCQVNHNGKVARPNPHTLRGLAMQGFHYATSDQAERVRAFIEERAQLIAAYHAGQLTDDEARLRATPYRDLIRGLAA